MAKLDLENSCVKLYSSLQTKGEKSLAFNYLKNKFAYPDEGSTFDKKQPMLKYVFRVAIAKPLLKSIISFYNKFLRYDSLFLYLSVGQDIKISSYLAFQEHNGNELHVFRIETEKAYRGNGFGIKLAEESIKYARESGYDYLRLGKDNEVMSKILKNWKAREEELGISILSNDFDKGSNFVSIHNN